MGSSLAIAATTAAICQLLREALAEDFPDAQVTPVDAEDAAQAGGPARVTVALAALASPSSRRNRDDRGLVVDLTYRIRCQGAAATFEAQRLLGAVATALHAAPLLGPELLERAVSATPSLAGFPAAAMAPVQLIQENDPEGPSLLYVARPVVLGAAAQAGIGFPGVPVEERPARPASIAGVPTSIAAFVGQAAAGPLQVPRRISSLRDYEQAFGGFDGGELAFAVRSWTENGGGEAWVVRTENRGADALIGDPHFGTGIHALAGVDLFNILCLPDMRLLPGAAHEAVAKSAAELCLRRRAMILLDPPAGLTSAGQARSWAEAAAPALGDFRINAAAYWPEPVASDPVTGEPRRIAASGVAAGLFARIDATRGVWKAPAGTEATVKGAKMLAAAATDSEQATLNPLGVNLIRDFPGKGILLWGARTLAGSESEWRYVPVRRLAMFIEESLYRGTKWVVFEANGEPMWAALRQMVAGFLDGLWKRGAFQGATPRDAWFVKCDASTTTQADLDAGTVNILVGFAPLKPAEFVVLKISQIAGGP